MKIIFLDIDGVLNVTCHARDSFGCMFWQPFVDNLKSIIDATGAKIVISSTWRFDGLDRMKKMWEIRQLPGEVIDITPHIDICKRGEEIEKWVNKNLHKVSKYVIIDDDKDMLHYQFKSFVQTSGNGNHPDSLDIGYGLTKQCAEQAINILNR
jgi:hypothetical protein